MTVNALQRTYQVADVGRALAIMLVIAGHTLMPWIVGPLPFNEPAFLSWKWGAAFLIPFFFFLSGLTWRANKSLTSTLREGLTLILLALSISVLWDAIHLVLSLAGLAAQLDQPHMTPMQFIKNSARAALFGYSYQATVVWFLTALATIRIATALVVRAPRSLHAPILIALVCLSLFAHAAEWRNVYHMQSVGIGATCAYLGLRLREAPNLLAPNWPVMLLVAIVSGIVLFTTHDANQGCMFSVNEVCGNPWYGGRFAVLVSHGNFGNLYWFALTCVAGMIFAFSTSSLIAQFGGIVARYLSIIGRSALGLFTVHALWFPVLAGVTVLWAPHYPGVPGHILIVLIGIGLNLALYALMRTPIRTLQRRVQKLATRVLSVFGARPAPPLPEAGGTS